MGELETTDHSIGDKWPFWNLLLPNSRIGCNIGIKTVVENKIEDSDILESVQNLGN